MTSTNATKSLEAVHTLNASDPVAYADAYYASFPDLLAHMAEEPKTWRDEELTAVLREAAARLEEAEVNTR